MKKTIVTIIVICIVSAAGTLTVLASTTGFKDLKQQKISKLDNSLNKPVELNTTWKEFLDSYKKDKKNINYFNPNPKISDSQKVRVVVTEYQNGLESKAGVYSKAKIINVYSAETDELLTTIGNYKR